MPTHNLITFALILAFCGSSRATVTTATNKTQWQNIVGPHTTITFVEYSNFTIITNQYAGLGIVFTDTNDYVFVNSTFPDNHALLNSAPFGQLGTVHMSFSQPRYSLGFDFTGHIQVELYYQGLPIFTSYGYVADVTPFLGFVSTTPFDGAKAWSFDTSQVNLDNIYFGPTSPPTTGACCLPSNTCQAMIQVECVYEHGIYNGDNIACPNVTCPHTCPSDINHNGVVNLDDLLAVINAWGSCPTSPNPCPSDVNLDHHVNIDDLLAVINAWGACP